MRARLGPEVFDLPVSEIRIGYRSAVYFSRAKRILEAERPGTVATIQVFQKGRSLLCGIDEALAILRVGAGSWSDPDEATRVFEAYLAARLDARALRLHDTDSALRARLRQLDLEAGLEELWVPAFEGLDVAALRDGDRIEPWETVLEITGSLHLFAHLESVYLGVLARRTKVASNVADVVAAAGGKPLLFFADRFDHFATQGGDGYAAHIAGARGVCTDAMAAWWGDHGLGTMPHGLIAAFGGDTVAAVQAFDRHVEGVDLVALTDFNNDNVGDSLACARAFGDRLWGVRLDTSGTMVDRSITPDRMGDFVPTGVNVPLVRLVRDALDAEGFEHVRIVVSGGFDAARIAEFEDAGAPVDAYAVGSALLRGSRDFTADVVAVDGRPLAKAGRRIRPNPRLEPVG
ncbi:MAG: quinolinate phosphoribosyl transferase [Actinobacteria bacterium]|nr:quinolinate phosphoribosyl transferase [Actinomycetota bacterium]